jgi:uncharacterized membrane protein YhaH (DUF805 family)
MPIQKYNETTGKSLKKVIIMYSQNVKPSMSLGESLTSVFNKYATFTGRARRSEYWWFSGCYFVLQIVFNFASLGMLAGVMSGEMSYNDPTFSMFQTMSVILGLGLLLPSLAVTVRRFHDIGKSGWNILWAAIPLIGAIIVLVWMCQDSDVVANKYGESPKYGN